MKTFVHDSVPARAIAPCGHDEAAAIAQTELQRILALVNSLSPEEWTLPTVCDLWDVRQLVAHIAGSAAAWSSWAEFSRQNNRTLQKPYRERGMTMIDAQNQIQVDDRENHTPEELVTELQAEGPKAIAFRKRLPAPVRAIRLPMGLVFPFGSTFVSIGYLTDVMLPRDWWMHRLDLSRATNHEMHLTAEHDGRMTALVMRDLVRILKGTIGDSGVLYDLTGTAGGSWTVGAGETAATIHMDALDFHLLASGRMTADDIQPRIAIEGNPDLAQRALVHTVVAY